jgi:NADPH:quinone reductase-like Zn-dependent oxidoreductase
LRRQVEFKFGGKTLIGIEQNPDTKSNWARMARDGMKVMQFIHEGKYIAVVGQSNSVQEANRAHRPQGWIGSTGGKTVHLQYTKVNCA